MVQSMLCKYPWSLLFGHAAGGGTNRCRKVVRGVRSGPRELAWADE